MIKQSINHLPEFNQLIVITDNVIFLNYAPFHRSSHTLNLYHKVAQIIFAAQKNYSATQNEAVFRKRRGKKERATFLLDR